MDHKILHCFPDPALQAAWRDCLRRVPCPSHYVAPEYFLEPFLAAQQPFAVLALDKDTVVGVLTGLHRGQHVICGLESRPQVCIDPTQDKTAVTKTLMEGLLTALCRATLVTIYTWADLEMPALCRRGFRCRQTERGNVVLDLTKGPEALFAEFTKDRRRNIRFAEKNGVDVSELTTPEDVSDAFAVYQIWSNTNRERTGVIPISFEQFRAAALRKENRLMLIARFQGKAIALNTFRFFPGGLFESASNASLEEFQYLKPNDLLQWRGIQWACSHGLRRHSLGGSHPFLRRFGGEVATVLRYQLDQSFLHRHELREATHDYGRAVLKAVPGMVTHLMQHIRGANPTQPRSRTKLPPPEMSNGPNAA